MVFCNAPINFCVKDDSKLRISFLIRDVRDAWEINA